MKISYRPDIDGLRALSVIAVIFYHASFEFNNHNFFEGGFLGVDIFFVISGYLITSLIVKEFKTTNKFSFLNFYNRRARRILPMLLFIIILFIPLAWFYLLPNSLIDFSNSIFFSTFFTSNILFNISGHDYGNSLSITKPFLHTWSLSVEEQFYILYPLFLIFFYKLLKKRVVLFLLLISLFSLSLAQYGSINFSISNFYLLPTRLWEIFCGAILVFIDKDKPTNIYISNFLSLFGLTIILLSFYFFSEQTHHPSFLTLIPVIGTMFIIKFSNNNITYKLLSKKYLVYIGLISYSLYLWHYPLFSFADLLGFKNSNLSKLVIILFSFILSFLSYHFIEKKFRNKVDVNNKFFYISLIVVIIIISSFSYFVFKEKGAPNRAQIIFTEEFKEKPWELLKDNNSACHLRTDKFCNFNPMGKNGSVFLVGDSHLITLGKPLSKYLIAKDFNFISLTNGGCYFLPNFDYVNSLTNEVAFGCDSSYQDKRLDLIMKKNNPIVIIGGNLNRYLSNTDVNNVNSPFVFRNKNNISIKTNLISSINKLLLNNIKVVLIYPIPEIPWDPLKKIFDASDSRNFNDVKKFISNNQVSTSYEDYVNRSKESFLVLDKINHENLYKIYPHSIFCNIENGSKCAVHNHENIFYFDSEHLSVVGATMLQKSIIKTIDKIK